MVYFFLIIKIRSKSNKNIENTKKTQLKTISDNSELAKSSTAREKYFLEIQKKESENKKII